MARVYMNDLILRLDEKITSHVQLAEQLMDLLLDKLSDGSLDGNQFPFTIEHRTKVRKKRRKIENFHLSFPAHALINSY